MDEAALRQRLKEMSARASRKERILWSKVKNRHPGQADHDPIAWKQWLDAANEVRALAIEFRALVPVR